MAMDGSLLADIAFFEALDEAQRSALASTMEQVSLPKGKMLFRMGDPGDALYLVRSGAVSLWLKDHIGERIDLDRCGVGHVFGELSLFDGGARTATAEVVEDCDLLVLQRDDLIDFLRRFPDAGVKMMTVLAARIRSSDELIRRRVSRNVNEEIEQRQSLVDRIANGISGFGGSMPFLYIHIAWFLVWVIINLDVIPGLVSFDPFPFGLLTMTVSLEAIFLSVFVLLSQNLQSAKDRVRADIEYQVNVKAELEVAHLHDKVDHLHEEVLQRLQHIQSRLTTQR